MQAIIMAGGKGTRFQEVSTTIPKILIPVGGKPLLDHVLSYLKKYDIDNVIICTGHLGDKVKEHIGQMDFGLRIQISNEDKPLGTAGALHLIRDKLEDEFFIIYGDEYSTVNLRKMFKFHRGKNSDATMAVHRSDHPEDSTVVKINGSGKVVNLVEKPGSNWRKYGNLTITPLFILKKEAISFIEKGMEVDLTKDVFPKMLKNGKSLFGYVTNEFIKDIGTLKRFKQVQNYLNKQK